MLILINMHIVGMVLDLMHVHNFHYLIIASAKMSLLLELIIVLLCILIIKKCLSSCWRTKRQKDLNTTITAEAWYPVNFTKSEKRFALRLHYNGSNSFLFVNATKTYQFKAKYSEIKSYTLFLGKFTFNKVFVLPWF